IKGPNAKRSDRRRQRTFPDADDAYKVSDSHSRTPAARLQGPISIKGSVKTKGLCRSEYAN
ncbi:MAG: hypothetical protein WCC08_06320, partial [Terrimicrobiaceae bacterium]